MNSTDLGGEGDRSPLYVRLAARIRADLEASGAGPGARLPSERDLSERYGVARVTVRGALQELRDRGVVNSFPARGWMVADGVLEGASKLRADKVQGFSDSASRRGLRMRSKVLEKGVRPATTREAELFRTAPGVELFEMRRLRFLDDLVIAAEHNRLPLALAPELAAADFRTQSLYALLRAADPPRVPRYADYSVEARMASGEERELLDIDDGVPILSATQLTFDQAGVPIELTVQAYRGDRYTFHASITD